MPCQRSKTLTGVDCQMEEGIIHKFFLPKMIIVERMAQYLYLDKY